MLDQDLRKKQKKRKGRLCFTVKRWYVYRYTWQTCPWNCDLKTTSTSVLTIAPPEDAGAFRTGRFARSLMTVNGKEQVQERILKSKAGSASVTLTAVETVHGARTTASECITIAILNDKKSQGEPSITGVVGLIGYYQQCRFSSVSLAARP